MRFRIKQDSWWVTIVATLFCLFAAQPLQAAEPAAQFLEGLRAQGYHDMALIYLERIKTSEIVSPDFKETIPYEEGLTLIQDSRNGDGVYREKQLNAAQAKFRAFVAKNPNHYLAPKASSQLGNVTVERARTKLNEAKDAPAASKAALMAESNALFDAGHKVFAKSVEDIKFMLKNIPKLLDPKSDRKLIARRDSLRADYVQAKLVMATILYEKAETVAKGPKRNEILKASADEFDTVYNNYRRLLAGLYARLYQGRCYQDMGGEKNIKEALSYYLELMGQPDKPDAFRKLRTQTLKSALVCWLELKQYKVAVEKTAPWIAGIRPNEASAAEWLELRYHAAIAMQLRAKETEDAKERTTLLSTAQDICKQVARYPGEFRKPAQTLLGELGPNSASPTEDKEPTTFYAARTKGNEALEVIQNSGVIIATLKARLPKIKDTTAAAEVKTQVTNAEKQLERGNADALKYFTMALKFTDSETSRDDINSVNYYLTYLHYSQGEYYESAVIGSFVSQKFPDARAARPAGNIAMAAFLKLYDDNKTDDKEFETKHVIDIAEHMFKHWSTQKEGQDALVTLINFSILRGNIDEARSYLERMPADSSKLGAAELKVGQALWRQYLTGMAQHRAKENDKDAVAPEKTKPELDVVKNDALNMLKNGVDRMSKSKISTSMVAAVLSLCQIYVDTGSANEAIKILEDPTFGPLALVESKNSIVAGISTYPQETYKTALRAYIGAMPKSSAPTELMAKAKEIMVSLDKRIGVDAAGKKKLIGIYISLARDLEQQIKLAPEADRVALSKGFEQFLDEVSKSATQFNVLNWIAETYVSLGTPFDNPEKITAPEKAKAFYRKSIAAYDRILKRAETDKKISDAMITQVKWRSAASMRRLGQFKEATEIFAEILAEKPSMLSVQIEAARTFQAWGDVSMASPQKDARLYTRALVGDKPDKNKKNIIWGWLKLGTITYSQFSRDPTKKAKYEPIFFEARYNIAICHLRFGLAQEAGSEKRAKYLGAAKTDITSLQDRFPEMGGPVWNNKFIALLRKIEKAN